MEQMLRNEHGRNDYRKMSDINLCEFIDKNILPEIGKTSVYLLTESEKQKIAQFLYLQKRLPEAQIKRCLAMLWQHSVLFVATDIFRRISSRRGKGTTLQPTFSVTTPTFERISSRRDKTKNPTDFEEPVGFIILYGS